MSPWIGEGLWLFGYVAVVLIRAPYMRRAATLEVRERRKSPLEGAIFVGMGIGMIGLPVLAVTPLLSFASYGLHPSAVIAGSGILLAALWLFWRSHADLGANWSVTLEVRQAHHLITTGVYARIRHPMYSSFFLWGLAQALVIPNWVAGPAGLVSFLALYLQRIGAEERMMLDHFGDEYRNYMRNTGRVLPRLTRQK